MTASGNKRDSNIHDIGNLTQKTIGGESSEDNVRNNINILPISSYIAYLYYIRQHKTFFNELIAQSCSA